MESTIKRKRKPKRIKKAFKFSPKNMARKLKAKAIYENNFAEILFKNKIQLKEIEHETIERGMPISYPVLLDLKNEKRGNFNARTIFEICEVLNKLVKKYRRKKKIQGEFKKITPDFLLAKVDDEPEEKD